MSTSRKARRPGLGAALASRGGATKTDNHPKAMAAKLELRRAALAWVGGAERAAVLDCFAGAGEMHRKVWGAAASYLGNDQDPAKVLAHPGRCHCAPAEFLLRFLDLSAFTVIDLDAYGSPWAEATIVGARRRLAPGERFALVVTDGGPRKAMLGGLPRALADLIGLGEEAKRAHGGQRAWPSLTRQAAEALARRMGGHVATMRMPAAAIGGRGMFYSFVGMQGGAAAA